MSWMCWYSTHKGHSDVLHSKYAFVARQTIQRALCNAFSSWKSVLAKTANCLILLHLKRGFRIFRKRHRLFKRTEAIQRLTLAASKLLLLKGPFRRLRRFSQRSSLLRWCAARLRWLQHSRALSHWRRLYVFRRAEAAAQHRLDMQIGDARSSEMYPLARSLRHQSERRLLQKHFLLWLRRFAVLISTGKSRITSFAAENDHKKKSTAAAEDVHHHRGSSIVATTALALERRESDGARVERMALRHILFPPLPQYFSNMNDFSDDDGFCIKATGGNGRQKSLFGDSISSDDEADSSKEVAAAAIVQRYCVRLRVLLRRWARINHTRRLSRVRGVAVMAQHQRRCMGRHFNAFVCAWLQNLRIRLRNETSAVQIITGKDSTASSSLLNRNQMLVFVLLYFSCFTFLSACCLA